MTKIIYSKASKKVLESYEKKLDLRIIKGIEGIPLGDIKKLEGKKVPPLYRLRIGKYRIIYAHFKTLKETMYTNKFNPLGRSLVSLPFTK